MSSSLARTDSKLGYRPGQYGTVVSITTNDTGSRKKGRIIQSEANYPTLYHDRSSRPGPTNSHASGQLNTRWTNPNLMESNANTPKPKTSRWKSLSRFGRKSSAKRNYDIVHQVPIYGKENNDSELFGRSLTQPVAGPYGLNLTFQEQQQYHQQQQEYQRFCQAQQTPQLQVLDESSAVHGNNPLQMNPQQLERSMSARVDSKRERISHQQGPQGGGTKRREEQPFLNVAIPKSDLERYSVMFGSILQQKDLNNLKRVSTRTPRASSLLARRHASLRPLETNHPKANSSRGAVTAFATEKPRFDQEIQRAVRSAGPGSPPPLPKQLQQRAIEPLSAPLKSRHEASPSLTLFPARDSPPTPPLPFKMPSTLPQPPVPPKKPTRLPPATPLMSNRPAPANVHIPDLRPHPLSTNAKAPTATTNSVNKSSPKPTNAPAPTIVIAAPPESPESMTTLETASSEASYEPSNISITQFPLPASKPLPTAVSKEQNDVISNLNMNNSTSIRSSLDFAPPRLIADPAHRESDTSMEIGIALGDPYLPIHQFSGSSSTINSYNNGSIIGNNYNSNQAFTTGHVYGLSNGGTQYPYPTAPEFDLDLDLDSGLKQDTRLAGAGKVQKSQSPSEKAVPALVSSRAKTSNPSRTTPKMTATKIPKAMTSASPNTNANVKPLTIPLKRDDGMGMEMGIGMEQSLQKGLGLGMTMGSSMENPAKSIAAVGTKPKAKTGVANQATRVATTKLVNNLNTTTTAATTTTTAVKSKATSVNANGANKARARNVGPVAMKMKQKKPLPPIGARIMVTASP